MRKTKGKWIRERVVWRPGGMVESGLGAWGVGLRLVVRWDLKERVDFEK